MATNSETRIGFIGVGTLGRGLALALDASGYNVTAAASRRRDSAQWLADRVPGCLVMDSAQQVSDACDLVFVTVPDGAIADVASLVRWRGAQGVVHCCGAASVELLESAAASGASVGAMHPFQTFAGLNDPADAARRLTGVTFAVAATGWLDSWLPDLATALGGRAITVPNDMRALYHASAVLSCGHVTALLNAAMSLWSQLGMDDGDALAAVMPLARATIEALSNVGVTDAVTGPAVRGDAATVKAHMDALQRNSPSLVPLYRQLALASLPLARSKGVNEAQINLLTDAVAGNDRA
jgi:predicted short-subunit dehydrogenase-like oxidoreductase (DUF2520 family)